MTDFTLKGEFMKEMLDRGLGLPWTWTVMISNSMS
jgi:hypothetical protein